VAEEQSTPQSDLPRDDDRTDKQQESASGGGDSPEGKAEQDQGEDTAPASGAAGEGQSDAMEAAEKAKEEQEEAKEKMKELEEDPPEKLEDWPDDKTKYETFGGAEGNESYDDSVTAKLGPSSLRHREDGSVEVEGEEVDDPDEYKGDPIPGGPTDPKADQSRAYGEPDLTDETSVDVEGSEEGGGEEKSEEGEEDTSEGTSEGTSSSSSSDDEDGEDDDEGGEAAS
jgi:hypothetical protein